MLPLSCLRCADSKSNSSTRLPRKTTTRVSSGWVASMSILLAIGRSHGDRARSCRAASAGGEDNGPIFVDWSGPKVASAASRARPAIGKRNTAEPFDMDLGCASNINSKPRRDGSAERGRDFASWRQCGAMALRGLAATNVTRTRSGSPLSPLASAELCVATNAAFVEDMIGLNIFSTKTVAVQRIESSVCPAPGSSLREPIVFEGADRGARTGGRHADTTGTFHRQHALHKAAAAELASRLWDLPAAV